MTPSMVVAQARRKGLHIIGICDHLCADNVRAVCQAARESGLAVIGGMEITSREEVHVLGLFEDPQDLDAVQDVVYDNLPGKNDPATFGEQLVMTAEDSVIRHNHRLLIGATELKLSDVVRLIHDCRGLAIASHVDRPSFSVLSQLGFIPDSLALDGVEVVQRIPAGLPEGLPVVRSSDAHRLSEIGARHTRILVESGTATEIGMALKGLNGRRVVSEEC